MVKSPKVFLEMLDSKCPLRLVIAALLLGACGPPPPAGESPPRFVMIGIDAGSWKLLDPLLARGDLPHLAALAGRGTTADLSTVEPVISPAVWTSIATGRLPAVHGVTTFFADRRAVQAPTVWERLAAAGLRVGLYDYLVTWPPRELPGGFMIPGWLRRDARVTPVDVFARAGVSPFYYEVLDVGSDDDVLAHLERELATKPATWNALADAFDLDAGAVVFYALDVTSHRFYHTEFPQEFKPPEFPAPPSFAPRFAGVMPSMARQLDAAVGEIVDALDEDDHVVVVSDHGIRASDTLTRRWGFDVLSLLERAGLDPQRDGVRVVNEFIFLSLAVEPGPADDDTEREAVLDRLVSLLESLRNAAGEALFEVEVTRRPATLAPADLLPWQADLIASEGPLHALVVATPHDERLAALWPAGEAIVAGESLAVEGFCAPHVFSGDHHPVGVFLAAGPAIRHQQKRTRLSVLDVAPLLLYLAGQPIPDDLRELPARLIVPQHLRRHPPQRIPAAAAPRLEGGDDGTTEGESEEIRKRLRALGYLD